MLDLVGTGGTFDRLHDGHRRLIETGLKVSNKLVIGLTTQKMLKRKKFGSKIEDFETRKKHLENFISSHSMHTLQLDHFPNKIDPKLQRHPHKDFSCRSKHRDIHH